MTDILAAYRATFVRRWHSNPDASDLHDEVGAHQGRVALLCLALWPDHHALPRAALMHDLGESGLGDVCGLAKRQYPDLAAIMHRIEGERMAAMKLPAVSLSEMEKRRVNLADMLDAYLFIRHRRPRLLSGDGWPETLDVIRATAWACGVGTQVEGLLK